MIDGRTPTVGTRVPRGYKPTRSTMDRVLARKRRSGLARISGLFGTLVGTHTTVEFDDDDDDGTERAGLDKCQGSQMMAGGEAASREW